MRKRLLEKIDNFFVIEGLDGSGTTTQLHRIEDAAAGMEPLLHATFEPTDNPIGRIIRSVLTGDMPVPPDTLMRLFSADRSMHLYEDDAGIKARSARGELVLCDRYLFSSIAYQALGNPIEEVISMNRFPLPEKVFFIEVSPEECARRRSSREKEELFDKTETQRKIRDNYYRAFDAFSACTIEIIDGTLPIEEITVQIWRSLPYPPIV